jgi:hypothetical protein
MRSGFPCAPPTPSPLAALRIMSLAWFRLASLSVPIWPSWISARLNGLNAGAGGTVDIGATPFGVCAGGRASFDSERREKGDKPPRQRSICEVPLRHIQYLCDFYENASPGRGRWDAPRTRVFQARSLIM